jgi:hypothetical protein
VTEEAPRRRPVRRPSRHSPLALRHGVGIDVNGDGLTDIVECVTNHDGYYETMIDVRLAMS